MNDKVEQIKKNITALMTSVTDLQAEMNEFSLNQQSQLKDILKLYSDPNDIPSDMKKKILDAKVKQVDALEGLACFYAFIETYAEGVDEFNSKMQQIENLIMSNSSLSIFDKIKFKMGF
jgi:hypothetical protein